MFDLGWTEMLVVGIVALIVIGPKDLPVLFRNVGRWVGKAKGMAREFSSAMNQAADDAGVKDIQKTIRTATNPVGSAMDGVKDAARDVTSSLSNLDPDSETAKMAADKAERAENARKIQAKTARAQAERKAKEAADALKKAEELEAAAPPPAPAKETKDG
ncbi:Sec-independent protein translocase protein TatB [uncultured Tateyamaria sp.]|uniref:Sec-independent protein translocase protein TatB n=1 Tax=uncultured Tateyamaria sp. TaxID=455651 RepID=UPI002616C19F|nr:Sec-independent protein translocase protein TatB [uncultured Tateyamaria sp.]